MNIIHFGAGNIGRGFIAPILKQDTKIKEIKFLDVNATLVEMINKQKKYIVTEVDEVNNEILIENISANISDDLLSGNLDNFILSTDCITISIGQQNLKYIIKYIEYILKIKKIQNKEILILCCENGNRVSTIFKELLIENKIESNLLKFIDVVVDRIVPDQSKNSINVLVEKYYSWIVDSKQWPKNFEEITSINYSNDLDAEVNKKICLLNGVHSSLAWYRYLIDQFEEPILQKVINLTDTIDFFNNITKELVTIISSKYGFERKYLEEYVKLIFLRFKNPKIEDEMSRIGRNPISKLQLNERILNPLVFALKNNLDCKYLSLTFNNILNYSNIDDKEACLLSNFIKNNSKETALSEFIKNLDTTTKEMLVNIIN